MFLSILNRSDIKRSKWATQLHGFPRFPESEEWVDVTSCFHYCRYSRKASQGKRAHRGWCSLLWDTIVKDSRRLEKLELSPHATETSGRAVPQTLHFVNFKQAADRYRVTKLTINTYHVRVRSRFPYVRNARRDAAKKRRWVFDEKSKATSAHASDGAGR